MELAWLEASAATGLGPAGNDALRRSYVLAPYGPEATLWRQGFVFDHWSSVPADIRIRALDEMSVVYSKKGWDLEELVKTVRDPSGRMIASMASRRLRTVERLRQGESRSAP
ncbi:hypothetical protein BH09PSE1_BH09PSE1_05110 [soil metagenome]